MNNRSVIAVLLLACFAVGSYAEEVTPADPPPLVAILQNALYFKSRPRPIEDRIRAIAVYETTVLGKSHPDWSSKHQQWPLVYGRVYSDLQLHAPEIAAAWDEERAQEEYRKAILSQLSREDVDELQRFAATASGFRYARFMRSLDRAFRSGSYDFDAEGRLVAHSHVPPALREQYFRIAHLSHLYQTLSAIHADPRATALERARFDASDTALESAFDAGSSQFNELLVTFHDDLPEFEAYTHSDLAQRVFKATAIVDRDLLKFTNNWGAATVSKIRESMRQTWVEFFAVTVK